MQYQIIILNAVYEDGYLVGLYSNGKSLIDLLPVTMDYLEYQSVLDIINYVDQYHYICESPYGTWVVFIQKVNEEQYGCFYWEVTNNLTETADTACVHVSPTSILLTNTDGFIIWANKQAEKQTEYSLAEMLGTKLDNTILSDLKDKRTVAYIKKCIRNNQPYEVDVMLKSKTGDNYWTRLTGVPHFDEDNDIERWVVGFYNIENEKSKIYSQSVQVEKDIADTRNLKKAIDSLVEVINKV